MMYATGPSFASRFHTQPARFGSASSTLTVPTLPQYITDVESLQQALAFLKQTPNTQNAIQVLTRLLCGSSQKHIFDQDQLFNATDGRKGNDLEIPALVQAIAQLFTQISSNLPTPSTGVTSPLDILYTSTVALQGLRQRALANPGESLAVLHDVARTLRLRAARTSDDNRTLAEELLHETRLRTAPDRLGTPIAALAELFQTLSAQMQAAR